MLDPQFQKDWCFALRSGEYPQTGGCLRRMTPRGSDSFCCLGVAGDLLHPNGWEKDGTYGPDGVYSFTYTPPELEFDPDTDIATACLPEHLGETVGLTMTMQTKAYGWNDQDGLSFAEIADRIERGDLGF